MLNAQQTLDHILFRAGHVEDAEQIVGMYREFFDVSDLPKLGLTFSTGNAMRWVERVIETASHPHILAIDRAANLAVGVINYAVDRSAAEPYAYLDKFYVVPAWRLSAIGRVLLHLAMDDAKADGCIAFRAGLSAGAPFSKNLFHRLGFHETPASVLMARRL